MKKNILTIAIFAFLFTIIFCVASEACSLFSANGALVEGGGTLIAKNRDYSPGVQTLRLRTDGKYEFFALYSSENKGQQTVRAGVNEKGLVVITAMAGSLPKKMRYAVPRRIVAKNLLSNCASVEECLQDMSIYKGPRFVMLADKNEIAYIEIDKDNKVIVKRAKNDYLIHTNHYLEPEFESSNIRYGASSHTRFNRLKQLFSAKKNFTMEDFTAFSQDRNDGPDNSLWRVGSSDKVSQTLASFVVSIFPNGKFRLWLKYRPEFKDKGQESIINLSSEQIFGK